MRSSAAKAEAETTRNEPNFESMPRLPIRGDTEVQNPGGPVVALDPRIARCVLLQPRLRVVIVPVLKSEANVLRMGCQEPEHLPVSRPNFRFIRFFL